MQEVKSVVRAVDKIVRAISAYHRRLAVALLLSGGIVAPPAYSIVQTVEFGNYAAVGGIPVGFSFSYYGKQVEKVTVNRYGVLAMESAGFAFEYNNFPLPYNRSALYVFWESLGVFNPESLGRVYYETQGVAPHRQFIVQWSHFTAGIGRRPVGEFQVILDEYSGSIKYQYQNAQGSSTVGSNATIGIEGPDKKFVQIAYRDKYAVGDQQAILFTPQHDMLDYKVDKQANFSFIDLATASAPTGHYLLPSSGEVTGDSVQIEIEATDVEQVTSVDFFVNDQWLSRQSSAPWRATWSTTTSEKGSYQLKAVITNRANRTTTITKTVSLTKVELVQPVSYLAEVTNVSPRVAWLTGQSVTLQGKVWVSNSQLPAANQPLVLHLRRNEQVLNINLNSDAEGNFSYQFIPKFDDNGNWHYAVTHPDEEAVFQPENFFRVEQLLFSHGQQLFNVSNSEPLIIGSEVLASTAVKGLYWALRAEDQPNKRLPVGISMRNNLSIDISAGNKADLYSELTILPIAGNQGEVRLTALSPASGRDPRGQRVISWQRVPDMAKLVLDPQRLNIGLQRGAPYTETIQLLNMGTQPAEQIQLSLVDEQGKPAPAWIFISSPTALGTLAQGEKLLIELTANPPSEISEGDYRFRILLKDNRQADLSLPVQLAISQQGQSRLAFHLSDIYTATTDAVGKKIAGVNQASIVLQNEAVLSQLWTLTSNEQGEAFVDQLPPGTYLWRISSDRHQDRQGRVVVHPGENIQSVFLDYQTVTINFDVKPTTIDDSYEIELHTTFQTYVPAPVLVITPAAINLAELKAGEEKQGNITIVNHGLVQAENIQLRLPTSDARFTYQFSQSMPKTLLPGEQITFNYRVTAKPLPGIRKERILRNNTASNEECSAYQSPLGVGWQSTCASGQRVSQQGQALFYELKGANCSLPDVDLSGQGGNYNHLGWLPIASSIQTAGCQPDCNSGCCQSQGTVAGDR